VKVVANKDINFTNALRNCLLIVLLSFVLFVVVEHILQVIVLNVLAKEWLRNIKKVIQTLNLLLKITQMNNITSLC
jgi:hypothetical protein